jgi:hypothetical protein
MLALINKHLKSGDTHLSNARFVVESNSDIIPAGSQAHFRKRLEGYVAPHSAADPPP